MKKPIAHCFLGEVRPGFRKLYWVEPPNMGFSSASSNSAELDKHCSYLLTAAGGPSRDGGVPDTANQKSL